LLSTAARELLIRPLAAPATTVEAWCDRLAVALLAVVGVLALLTFRDYGLSWDDYTHSQYGDLLLKFYVSGLHDQRALSWVNLYYYGGGFDLLSAAAAKVLPFTLFETRRLVGAAIGLGGLFVTWRIGRRVGGPLAGIAALALLAACPLYYGQMFMNPKDAPFAASMAVLLLFSVRAIEEYPRPSLTTAAFLGTGFGLAFGSRIMAGFGALELLGALGLIAAAEARSQGIAAAGSRVGRFLVSLLPAVLLAYPVMAVLWPWGAADPTNPFRAIAYFSRFFEKPWSELFDGVLTPVTIMPRNYVPTLVALKLPEILLALGLTGAAGALVMSARREVPLTRRAVLLLLILAAILPPAVTVALRPAMYNGIRHFIFVLPPLAVLGGLAVTWFVAALRNISARRPLLIASGLVFALGLSLPVVAMTRLHPYEYTYFNDLSGGVSNGREHYMLDYWGLSLKQASHALVAKLAAEREQKPAGRRWKIAVCGPHRSPEVELGPDFEITWDPKSADFAMMLGEFYCRKLDAPVVVKVVRAGVVYARVYDIRARSYQTLLTLPGL
jgi:hypothetical protein